MKISNGGLNYKRFDEETLKEIYRVARDLEVKGEMRDKEIHLLRLDTLHEDDFDKWHYIDDTTGATLDPKLVIAGRKGEINIFKELRRGWSLSTNVVNMFHVCKECIQTNSQIIQ